MKRLSLLLAAATCCGLLTACKSPLGPLVVKDVTMAGVSFGVNQYPSALPYLQAARDIICHLAGQGVLDPAKITAELDSKIKELQTPEGKLILQAALDLYMGFYYQFKDQISEPAMASYLKAVCDGMVAGLPMDSKTLFWPKPLTWPRLK